jgi:hypothetical protein
MADKAPERGAVDLQSRPIGVFGIADSDGAIEVRDLNALAGFAGVAARAPHRARLIVL